MPRLTLLNSDAGTTIEVPAGGNWIVDGTSNADLISIASGAIVTINGGAGDDLITLAGSPADYTVKTVGSNLVLTDASSRTITIPLPTSAAPDTLSFSNGATAQISVNEAGTAGMLGSQTLTTTDSAISGTTGGTETNYTLSLADASVTEGNSGNTQAVFTLTLDQAPTSALAVNYQTADGTATAGSDYAASSGTAIFAAGQTSQTVSVPVVSDTAIESDETFTLSLSNPSAGLILGQSSAIGTIINDDDNVVVVSVGDTSVVEGNSGATNAVFTLTLDQTPTSAFTVNYQTADGTATAGSDYAASSGTVIFAAGQTTQTVSVPVVGDKLVEPDETFTLSLSLSDPSAVLTLGQSSATGTITDDDVPVLSIGNTSVIEGNSGATNAVFTLTFDQAPTRALTVNYQTANGTAMAGSDYAASSGTVTLVPGQLTQTVNVPVVGDTTIESDETFTLSLSNPSAGLALGQSSAIGTITNDDASVLSIGNASVVEGNSGVTNAIFTLTLDQAPINALTVKYQTANDKATAGSDYAASSGIVTFAAGQITQTVSVPVVGDTVVESDETFTLSLSSPSAGLILGQSSAIGTIINDDGAVVSISNTSVAEGNSGTTNAVFTLTLDQAPASALTVNYQTVNGSAMAGSDYAASSGTVIFAAGQTTQTVNVPVIGDTVVESDETFMLSLSSPSAGLILGQSSAIGTITNDDVLAPVVGQPVMGFSAGDGPLIYLV